MQEEKKRSSETEDHEKQRLAKILKQGDENKLERKLRLENDAYQTAQVGPGDRGRKKGKKRYGLNLYLDIEQKNSMDEPLALQWNHFLVNDPTYHSTLVQSTTRT